MIADNDIYKGRYECKRCHRQFTVTTKSALHSTKLPLWKWLQDMYLIVSFSKGISSVILARLIGVTQPTAWRMGHTILKMMDPQQSDGLLLHGIVELDETYVGGQPVQRYLHELSFRWDHRATEFRKTKSGRTKRVMKPIPIIDMRMLLIMGISGCHLKRTPQWGFNEVAFC
jgi:hypothetical protein